MHRRTWVALSRITIPLSAVLLSIVGCASPPEPERRRGPSRQPIRVVTDGRFDEWPPSSRVLEDPIDAPADAAVDLGAVDLLDDPRYLHLAVEVRREVNPQRMRGTLRILFDADADPSTGAELEGLEGVDAIVELSRRDRDPDARYGAGIAVRAVSAAGPGRAESGYSVGLVSAPTYAASRFELRLERGGVLGAGEGAVGAALLFAAPSMRLRLVFEDAAGVRDATGVATYFFSTPYLETPQQGSGIEPSIAKAGGAWRIVAWNVAEESLRERPEGFQRILAALDPDVILLDEVYGAVGAEELESFFGGGPLGALGTWRFVLGRSGGRQKNVVATRLPIEPAAELLDVAYPAGALEALAEEVGSADFDAIAALEKERGLATAGAWVTLGARRALMVPLDLQSSGYAGSPEDRLRELQATALRERIAAVLASSGESALVIGGDLNLVGSRRPLDALRRGLDGGGELAVAEAYRLGDRSQVTWRDAERGDFTPGRLDFLLYTATALRLERAFVFDPGKLSQERMGIESGDRRGSNHLPVAGDFRWVERP